MTLHNVKRSNLYNDLRKSLENMVICDTHEHLGSEEAWINTDYPDWTNILGYCMTDLYNAGMSQDALPFPPNRNPVMKADFGYDPTPKIQESWDKKWEAVKPYWKYIRHNGAGIITRKCLKIFFDCDDLTDETVPKIQEKYKEFLKPGAYKRILTDRGKFSNVITIATSLEETPATEILAPLIYFDQFCDIEDRIDLYRIEQLADQEVYSMKTYLKAVDTILERYKKQGCLGIKWHRMAYLRDNYFAQASFAEAEKEFVQILKKPHRGGAGSSSSVGFEHMSKFQDYMVHYMIQRSIEYDWGVQIHAATLGLSYGGLNMESEVKNLSELFVRYPQANFDMLHGSFPFTRQLHSLIHLLPNVYSNPSWVELLSPIMYKSYFKELLTSVPTTKLFGCGPDQFDPLLSVAYADLTRDLWAQILEDLITEGYMTEEDAMVTAKQILYTNPTELYKLDDRIIPNK